MSSEPTPSSAAPPRGRTDVGQIVGGSYITIVTTNTNKKVMRASYPIEVLSFCWLWGGRQSGGRGSL
eukprot:2564821-Pleurochrysis_carterae.AAC.1